MELNKKGYMLIEIILASAIAFGIGYFILQMVINLKNKNDDLLVETLTTTDQTIIMNKLMEYAQKNDTDFCDKLTISGKVIKYGNDVIDIVNDYAIVGEKICSNTDGNISVSIPLSVNQLKDKKFDANFYSWKKIIVSDNTITSDVDDDDGAQVGSKMYSIIFDCGNYAYWDRSAGSNILKVTYDEEFEILPAFVCVQRETGKKGSTWWLEGKSAYQYDTGRKVKYSELFNSGGLSDTEKANKTAIFSPVY